MAITIDSRSQATVHPQLDHIHDVAAGIVTTARPYQWAKNAAVLIVPGLAVFTLSIAQILHAGLAVVAFCLAASSVYFLNDTLDRQSDHWHPLKKYRPIASGVISPATAIAATAVLAVAGLAIAFAVSPGLGLIVSSYLSLTAGYSLALKHVPILDVATLALGFVLRVIAGAVAINMMAPPLLLIAVFAAAAMIALGKRHAEATLLGDDAATHRPALSAYTPVRLEHMLVDMQVVSVIAFTAWVITAIAAPYTLALGAVAALCMHIALGAYRRTLLTSGAGGDPTRDLAANPLVIASLALAGLTALSTGLI